MSTTDQTPDPRVAGFSDGTTYEEGRPDYPDDAVACLATKLDLRLGTSVLDLAAGTGKLTRQLAPLGVALTAVEPSESMRAELTRQVPGVPVLDGSAECIPLAAEAVDSVVVAQAFHWFDASKALAEISRVLRPGGGLGLVWNERDETVDWVHKLSLAMKWPDYQPYAVGMDFRPVLDHSGLFGDVERHQFHFQQILDRRRLLLRVESTSYITALPLPERDHLMGPVRELVSKLTEPIHLPYITDLYICRLAERGETGDPGR